MSEKHSIAFQAGQKARKNGIPLEQSAIRHLRQGTRQYEEYAAGYGAAGDANRAKSSAIRA